MFSHSFPTRRSLALLVAAALSGLAPRAFAGPASPQVVAGQASFAQQGNVFSITSTPNTIINWASFSVNQGEVARFIQQSSGSAVLNRITGQDPTRILGSLQSNGKVFLINPNGVLFGTGAQVDVNGLVASSLNISNADFLANKLHFSGAAGAGAVSNQGAITTPSGGQVFLIAPNVGNSGIIQSPQGEVILAAGHSVQLADSGNPDLHVVVSAPADQALNLGQVIAQGGRIGIYGALINQRGAVSADSAVLGANGRIVFKSSGTTTLAAGSRSSASNSAGSGGAVEVLGPSVSLEGDARIDASGTGGGGTVLVGGGVHGANASVPNAQAVYVSPDAVIAADAVANGKGGTVAVWSDRSTRMFGSISARGGANGGDGGFIETSGHYLAVDGARIDTRAQGAGATGQWLLDPYDIDVVASGGSVSLIDASSSGNGPQSGVSSINAALISGATSNVTLQASDNITFSSAVNIAASGVGLSAQAGNGIIVSAPVTTHGGALNLQAGGSAGLTTSAALNAGSGAVSLTADSMRLGAAVSGNSVTLAPYSPAQRIALGEAGSSGTLGLLQSDINQLNTGVLTIAGNSGGGDFSVSSAVSFPNTLQYLTVSTHGNMLISAPLVMQAATATLYADVFDEGHALTVNGGGSLAARTIALQAGTMNLGGAVSGSGSVQLSPYLNSDSVDIGGGASGAGVLSLSQSALTQVVTPSLNIVGHGGITVSAPVTLNQNGVTLTSGAALTILDGDSLSGKSVTLQGDGILLAGTLNASVGANIMPFTSGRGIALGSGASDVLVLGATDLNHIVTPLLQVGTTQGGAIGVNGAVELDDNVRSLNLFSAGAVSLAAPLTLEHAGGVLTVHGASLGQNGAGVVSAPVLNVSTSGALDLTQAANQLGTVTASAASIALGNSGDLAIGAAGLALSGNDANGNIAVNANGLLSVNGNVQAGAGNVALTGASVDAGVGAASRIAIGGAGVTLTASTPVSGSIHLGNTGIQATDALLQSDQMTLGATSAVTAGGVALRPFSADRAIAVGTSCSDDGCLGIGSLNNVVAGSVAIGSGSSGAITVGNIGSGAGTLNAATTTLALLSGRSVTQDAGSAIAVRDLAVSAVGSLTLDQANQVQNIAATLRSDGAALVVSGAGAVNVAHLSDGALGYDIAGIGDASGEIVLSAGGAITQGNGAPIAAHALTVSATNGIGTLAAPLLTQVAVLDATNVRAGGSAPISIRNNSDAPGTLTLTGALQDGPGRSNGGAISIENTGAFEVPAAATVSTSSGNISLVAHSPLTIAGTVTTSSGNIALEAGATGSAADVLSIAGSAQVTTAQGNIALKAGSTIDIDGAARVTAPHGLVTQLPSQNTATPPTGPTGPTPPTGPTLDQCIANPATPGCAAVLPPILTCIVNPATPGCAAVLPPILTCIVNPATPGCTAVLPPLSACIAHPAMNGCAAVLPPLSACIANPAMSGCAAVLPPLSACIANPAMSGCAAVLPPLSACVANPAMNGCAAVLPPLSACVANPAMNGCAAVLPPLSACIANPAMNGCAAVLPPLSACVANPAMNGCAAVLPPLSACVANPAMSGCAAVLPPLSACVANPAMNGCAAVLPPLSACVANPAMNGCAAVLPPLSSCVANPAMSGCAAVLPPLSACVANPAMNGCAAVLPPLSSCVANPAMNGCTAVLPPLSACVANPAMNGCAAVLPPLSSCVANPAMNGCTAVLPPLSSCVANPAMNGCTAVLPLLSACVVNPAMNGCAAVLPPLSACVANPATNGCAAVLPTLSACSVNPGTAGCSAVLPTLGQCTASPGLQGCASVLPSVGQCVSNPAAAGCPAVLPTLAQCVANPAASGCSAILPTLSQCVANPLAAGCAAVLPTLAQCAATPALPGCVAVTPPSNPSTPVVPPGGASQDQCALTPSLALCQVLTPPTQSTPAKPVTTAVNAVVALIPTAPGGNAAQPADGGSGGGTPNSSGSASVAASPNNGASKNDTAKKMYCN
jgi:filamentous hemagglutinin family protein